MLPETRTMLNAGGGPIPGYHWSIEAFDAVLAEASKLFTEPQYWHVVDQFRQLASEVDPTHSNIVSIDAIEDFLELREKGGPLGRLNARIYFFLDKQNKCIVLLGARKKENNGPTTVACRIAMRHRLRRYRLQRR